MPLQVRYVPFSDKHNLESSEQSRKTASFPLHSEFRFENEVETVFTKWGDTLTPSLQGHIFRIKKAREVGEDY